MSAQSASAKRRTIGDFSKGGEPIVGLTAYTAPMAQLLDPQVDFLLVGDSLGMSTRILAETGCGAVKLEGGAEMADTVRVSDRTSRAGDGPCRAAIGQRRWRFPRAGPRCCFADEGRGPLRPAASGSASS